jgi:hypothetical protein
VDAVGVGAIAIGSADVTEITILSDGLSSSIVEAELDIISDGSISASEVAADVATQAEIDLKLDLAGGTMTGALVADEQGVEFLESDDAVTCAAGDYWLRADLSETVLKKCENGSETVMDTTGGTPAFSDITGATNTTAAMVVGSGASLGATGVGSGASLGATGTGTITATGVDAVTTGTISIGSADVTEITILSDGLSSSIVEAELDIISDGVITLSGAEVGGILDGANGGTNNGFMDFTGPTTSLKTFTLPDVTSTILTDNDTVTVAQGGTGQTTYTDGQLLIGNTTGNTLAKAELQAEVGGEITVTNGSGTITLDVGADTIDHAELAATVTFSDGDLLDFGTNISSATEGILLPKHATSCASATGEGQICWDADDDSATGLWIGDGTTARNIGTGGSGLTSLNSQTGNTQVFSSTNASINITSGSPADDHDIEVDVTPGTGSATLEISDDAVQVKYFADDFDETANGLEIDDVNWANQTEVDNKLFNNTSDVMTGTLTADGLILGSTETIQLGATETLQHDGTDFLFSDQVNATSFTTGAVATPLITLLDNGFSGEGKIALVDATGPESSMTFQVDTGAGADTTMLELDGVGDVIEIGLPGTNYVGITTGGVMSFTGTAGFSFDATDLIDLSGIDASTATEGLILPQIASACASAIGEGQICWDTAGQDLYVGNGAAAVQMNGGGAPAFSSITGDTSTGEAMVVGTGSSITLTGTGAITASDVQIQAGGAPTANGLVRYDSTSNTLEYGANAVNRTVVNTNEAQSLSNKTFSASNNSFDLSAGVSVTGIIDDQLIVGTGSNTTDYSTLTTCAGAGNALTYNTTGNAFGCETDVVLSTGEAGYAGTHDFSTATAIRVENNNALSLGGTGDIGIDTTDDQFQYRSNAVAHVLTPVRTKCATIESATTSDVNVPVFSMPELATVIANGCSVDGTSATAQLTDGAGNIVDGAQTCATGATAITWDTAMAGTATFTSGEMVEIDVTAASAVNWLTFCFQYTLDAQ